jgi:hypothetical protein
MVSKHNCYLTKVAINVKLFVIDVFENLANTIFRYVTDLALRNYTKNTHITLLHDMSIFLSFLMLKLKKPDVFENDQCSLKNLLKIFPKETVNIENQ